MKGRKQEELTIDAIARAPSTAQTLPQELRRQWSEVAQFGLSSAVLVPSILWALGGRGWVEVAHSVLFFGVLGVVGGALIVTIQYLEVAAVRRRGLVERQPDT